MSRPNYSSVDKFKMRVPRLSLSERDHQKQREREYGQNIGNNWPNPVASRGHDDYLYKQAIEKNEYFRHEGRSRGYVNRLDYEEKEYYKENSGGIAPKDHYDLAPKAGRWENAARK